MSDYFGARLAPLVHFGNPELEFLELSEQVNIRRSGSYLSQARQKELLDSMWQRVERLTEWMRWQYIFNHAQRVDAPGNFKTVGNANQREVDYVYDGGYMQETGERKKVSFIPDDKIVCFAEGTYIPLRVVEKERSQGTKYLQESKLPFLYVSSWRAIDPVHMPALAVIELGK